MSNWIDAAKLPPDKDGRYLVCYGSVFLAYYTKSTNNWRHENSNTGLNQYVTHWMLLLER